MEVDKQLYVSFIDCDISTKVRELDAQRVGTLVKICGQVRKNTVLRKEEENSLKP